VFGIRLYAKQRRDKNGRSKGIDGEVVKKLEHSREMSISFTEKDSDEDLIKKYAEACKGANKDHKDRTGFWNKYRK